MTFHTIFKVNGKNQTLLKIHDFIGNLTFFLIVILVYKSTSFGYVTFITFLVLIQYHVFPLAVDKHSFMS